MSIITDKEHIFTTCKLGMQNNCCSYLAVSAAGFECLKESELKNTIDHRRKLNSMVAMGNNCNGFEIENIKNKS